MKFNRDKYVDSLHSMAEELDLLSNRLSDHADRLVDETSTSESLAARANLTVLFHSLIPADQRSVEDADYAAMADAIRQLVAQLRLNVDSVQRLRAEAVSQHRAASGRADAATLELRAAQDRVAEMTSAFNDLVDKHIGPVENEDDWVAADSVKTFRAKVSALDKYLSSVTGTKTRERVEEPDKSAWADATRRTKSKDEHLSDDPVDFLLDMLKGAPEAWEQIKKGFK